MEKIDEQMKPYKVLIFIVCVMSGLAVLCVVLPGRFTFGERELRWPTMAEVLSPTQPPHEGEEEDPTQPQSPTQPPIEGEEIEEIGTIAEEIPPIPKVSVDSTTDSRIFLNAFYASIPECNERVVRVLHYGDSQIEEDRMTAQIRDALQSRYGGQGVGMMPLVQTIPSLSVKQQLFLSGRYVSPAQGPKRYFVYGFKRDQRSDGLYGAMGQMSVMNDSLVTGSEDIMTVCRPAGEKLRYSRWKVFADTTIRYSFAGDTVYLNGRGNVYGLSQESETGIIVDNIAMRGCLGTVFTKIDSTQLADFYREQNVRLIIMQFGGNAIPTNRQPGTIQSIAYGLREQVRYLRSCAPRASILFIGPSDMLTQTDGQWTTYPMVPYMDKLLRKMAMEENIAYFSLYRWMGGAGSMLRWQEVGLAGSDGVHFTRAGARKAGNAIAEWILDGNDGMME